MNSTSPRRLQVTNYNMARGLMSAAINGPTAQVRYHCLEPAEQEWACAEFPAAILDWGTEKAWDRPNPPQVARTKLAAKTTTRMNLSGIQPIRNACFAGYTPFEFVILCSNRWLKIEVTVNEKIQMKPSLGSRPRSVATRQDEGGLEPRLN